MMLAMYENPLYSPFIVPVSGTIMILGIVVAGIWSGVRTREMQSQERLAAIAKGMTPPPSPEELALTRPGRHLGRVNDGAGARRTGIVLVSVAIGLFAFFAALAVILQSRGVLCGAAAGLIPLAIGIGFLVDANARRRELERAMADVAMTPSGLSSTAQTPSGLR